jgi:AcrR family transcriptional regulator
MNRTSKSKHAYSPRVQKKRDQARREILDVARKLLKEGGVEAVTLASVAGVLDMTKQALYHYFPSKEALTRSLVTALIDDEVESLVAAIAAVDSEKETLGTLIRAFYDHYINDLNGFRAVYCQLQLYSPSDQSMDERTIRDDINPRTRHLFDSLEARLTTRGMSKSRRERLRRLAFTAWTSALGLMTIRGVTDALDDPLVHSDEDLLATLAATFDGAAARP